MIRYFKQYIESTKEVEISKARAVRGLGLVYKYPKRVLRVLPIGYIIKVGWAYYKRVNTK